MSKSCPYCGNVVDDHIGKCPKCGLDFANRPARAAESTTQQSPGGFPTAPDPFSSPGIWNPNKGQPVLQPVRTSRAGRTIAIIAAAVLVLGGVGAAFFFVTKEVTRNLDNPTVPLGETGGTILDVKGHGNGKDKDNDDDGPAKEGAPEVDGSRELFRLMNRNGAKCTGYNQVIDTTTVDAASCFAGTEAWTIQVFFDDLSYDAVVANYRASDTIDVAYGGNWTVLVQVEKSAKKIARALGGHWS